MSDRTIQLLGLSYGDSPATITVHVNGVLSYSGQVDSINSPAPVLGSGVSFVPTKPLSAFEVPTDFVGAIPVTISAAAGTQTLIIAEISRNNVADESNPATLVKYPHPVKSNVQVDGQAQGEPSRDETTGGDWWYELKAGSTISFDVNVPAEAKTTFNGPLPTEIAASELEARRLRAAYEGATPA